MGLLDDLQRSLNGLGNRSASAQNYSPAQKNAAGDGGGWGDLLGPGVLGGLIGAFLPGRGGMLKSGGATALATYLWSKYKDKIMPPAGGAQVQAPATPAAALPAELDPAVQRMIRAMVFAAKSDGHIDDSEQAAINARLAQTGAGPEAAKMVNQAINEPLDPQLVAEGVSSPEEAMSLFLISSSVIRLDHFMENSYLDALAKALGLPEEMKAEIEQKAQSA